ELLDLVGEFDDLEAVDVPRMLELLRSRQLGLPEDPVVALLELALLRPEEVATPEDRDPEIVLDGIQVDVGGEGPVRDEDATHAPKVLLKFRGDDLFEFSEDDRLVHRPAHRASVFVPHGAEVARVRSFAAFLAEHDGAKALFDRAVADVQCGVRPDRRDADLRRIVALEYLHNVLALDHRDPCLEPMRCPSIILCCGTQNLTMRLHRFPRGTTRQRLSRRTALVDRGDFASGTSGKTSRLIHGGLRYLQNYKVGLVRLAVRERDRLLETAPGLIHPLPFVIPAYRGRSPGPILLRFGLFLYD